MPKVKNSKVSVSLLTLKEIDYQLRAKRTYRSRCPRIDIRLGEGDLVPILLDLGAEVNMIQESYAKHAGLAIKSLPQNMRNENLLAVNGTSDPFIGLVDTWVLVTDIAITFKIVFLVTQACLSKVILREPFACWALLSMQRTPSSKVIVNLVSKDGRDSYEIEAI